MTSKAHASEIKGTFNALTDAGAMVTSLGEIIEELTEDRDMKVSEIERLEGLVDSRDEEISSLEEKIIELEKGAST